MWLRLRNLQTMVEIHHVYIVLVWVDADGNIIDKNDINTKLNDLKNVYTQEHRIEPNLSGPTSTANSADYPNIRTYLAAEAANGFAIAYMDQYQLITQMIV